MEKKVQVLVFLLVVALLFYVVQSSYALFRTHADGSLGSVSFAKFVFEGELTDTLSFDIQNLLPGESKTFHFTVSNVDSSVTTDVTVNYEISVDSLEMLPLTYTLTVGSSPTNLFTCGSGGTYLCETGDIALTYTDNTTRTYTLTVSFPSLDGNNNPWGEEYANKIESVNLRIHSWQVTS